MSLITVYFYEVNWCVTFFFTV